MPRLAETSSSTTRTTGVRDDDDARGWPEFVNGDIVVVGKRVKIPRIFIKSARGDGVTKDGRFPSPFFFFLFRPANATDVAFDRVARVAQSNSTHCRPKPSPFPASYCAYGGEIG